MPVRGIQSPIDEHTVYFRGIHIKNGITMQVLLLIACLAGVALAQNGNRIDICNNMADGTFYKDFSDCKRYIACVGGRSLFGSCPDQLLFNGTKAACDYSNKVQCNSCPRTGLKTYPLEGSCRKYVRCFSGAAEYLECPDDLFFDPRRESCNLQSEVDCTEKICSANGNYLVASKDDCSVYYQCSRGVAKRVECKGGLYYNEKTRDCDARENVVCNVQPPREVELGDVSIACPPRGEQAYPHPADCSHYFLCLNGVSALLDCGPALRYDIVSQQCVQPEKAQCITKFK